MIFNVSETNAGGGGGGGGVETAIVNGISATSVLYYTDANMQVQSGTSIDNLALPIGTLIFAYNSSVSPFPVQPSGATTVVSYSRNMYVVYKVTG